MIDCFKALENNFWNKVDAIVGGIEELTAVVLSASGFRNYSSIKGVILTDELMANIVERVKKLKINSLFYDLILKSTNDNPEEFELLPGTEGSIKNVFNEINKLEVHDFDQFNIEIVNVDEILIPTSSTNRSKKRPANDPAQSSSFKIPKLSEEIHAVKLKEKVIEIISIANPSIEPNSIDISMIPSNMNNDNLSYKVQCFLCSAKLSLSVVVLDNKYVQYRVSNYSRHIEKKHEVEGQRIKEKKQLFGIYDEEDDDEFLQEIKLKLKTVPRFRPDIENILKNYKESNNKNNMFYKLLCESSTTFQRGHQGNRFDYDLLALKQFSMYLYLKGGFGTYQAISKNAPMPSVSILKNGIQEDRMEPGKIYARELYFFLKKNNLPSHVIIAEDATRILDRVELDPQTNELFGLLAETDERTGMPKANYFKLDKPSKLEIFLKNYKTAPYIQTILAKPYQLDSPTMVIGAFPTNNSYTSSNVIDRWNYITAELEEFGISCVFSSDGDPRLLGAMKMFTGFGKLYSFDELNLSLICDIDAKSKCMQDSIHLTNKLKNRLFDSANDLEIGEFLATINHIRILMDNTSKDLHKLANSDINANDSSRDKMNSESTRKICTNEVIELVENNVVGSSGTVAYLKMIRAIYNAFIELEISSIDRLYFGYYAICFIRIWRNNVSGNANDNFITNNVWTSIEINFVYLLDLVLKGDGHMSIIWNSQTCEELFRTLRSLSTYGLTEINFTLLEALEKINRVRQIQDLSYDLRDTFVLIENEKMKSDKSFKHKVPVYKPNITECKTALEKAKSDVELLCRQLKMQTIEECSPEIFLKSTILNTRQEVRGNDYETASFDTSNIIQVKNLLILDEESDSNQFKIVSENGEIVDNIKKSKLLWLLQDEKAKVSSDRSIRFRTGKKDMIVERIQSDSAFYVDKVLQPGDYICIKYNSKDYICVVGQIIKFKNLEGNTKLEKRYPYRNYIIGVNKNVSVRFLPSYFIDKRGRLISCDLKYFKISNYLFSVKPEVLNVSRNRLDSRNFILLKEKLLS